MADSILHLDRNAQAHIDAYLEYYNIVGDTDGGKLLSEKEYEEFKARAVEARKNRLYVSWQNANGLDCRQIGPSSSCFCTHRYRDHATDRVDDRHVHCRMKGCKCSLFSYIPVKGTQDLRCHCKHSYTDHSAQNRLCNRVRDDYALLLVGWHVDLILLKYADHRTAFESKEERVALGKRVDNLWEGGKGYAALGGLTSFSSLIDGVDRCEIRDQEQPYGSALVHAAPRSKQKLTEEQEMELYRKGFNAQKKATALAHREASVRKPCVARQDTHLMPRTSSVLPPPETKLAATLSKPVSVPESKLSLLKSKHSLAPRKGGAA